MIDALSYVADFSFRTVHNGCGYSSHRKSSTYRGYGDTPGERWQISHGGPTKAAFREKITEALNEKAASDEV